MLKIYPVAIEMVRDVNALCVMVAKHDADLARQLRRSSMSVVLNIGEGSGSSAGTRRARYESARGSARETLCGLEAAAAVGYVPALSMQQRNRFDWILGVLHKVTH
jgi:four helix bundle protein